MAAEQEIELVPKGPETSAAAPVVAATSSAAKGGSGTACATPCWWSRNAFSVLAGVLQLAILILFGANKIEYSEGALAKNAGAGAADASVGLMYPFWTDVHAMIFIGFGFLMTFLARYSWTGVGYNFIVAALSVQWALLAYGFWHKVFLDEWGHPLVLNMPALVNADFATGSVLITLGVVLGRVSMAEMVVIMFFEVILFCLNESLGVNVLKVADIGGSMFIHAFGAYFGLALSAVLGDRSNGQGDLRTSKTNSTFAMVGTLVLWIFWPSFNGALGAPDQQQRAVVNTLLSISAACCASFATSKVVRGGKFNMEEVQNSTLAGGVAIGTAANFMMHGWGSILVGILAGTISTLGFAFLTPLLKSRFGLADTCGVHNLHGMPGIVGGIVGAVASAAATDSEYGDAAHFIWTERTAGGRTASEQGGYQGAALVITIAIGLAGGALVGGLLRTGWFAPMRAQWYDDAFEWDVAHVADEDHDEEKGRKEDDALQARIEAAVAEAVARALAAKAASDAVIPSAPAAVSAATSGASDAVTAPAVEVTTA